MRGKWSRHDPLMMRFVQPFVQDWVVKTSMDPVDAEVRKQEEEWELNVIVCASEHPDEWMSNFGYVIVDEAVSADFGNEEWEGEHSHHRHGAQSLFDLHLQLVLEVFRVLEGCLIENEGV